MKKLYYIFLVLPLWLHAQKTSIDFEFYTHDFGTIQEDGGKVSYEFTFTNSGNQPLKITNVQAACGCTVADWPKSAFAPGEKGKIAVTFDPYNKPGQVNKSLTISTNAQQETVLLYVVGKVIPKPKRPTDTYPDVLGGIRLVSRYLNMGDVSTKSIEKKEFTLFNASDSAIYIKGIDFNKEFLDIKIEPAEILPHQKATVYVQYNPEKRNDYGAVTDKFEIMTSDAKMPAKTLYVVTNITKHFDNYSIEQAQKAPKFSVDKKLHDFGIVKQGEKLKTVFTITNSGSEKLQIYKVKPACGCTLSELSKKVIAKGDTAKLTLIFDTAGKEGVQEKHINIYTNDPTNHNPVISLKAKIVTLLPPK